jgi:hypothetical protein
MFSEQERSSLSNLVSLDEILKLLKGFKCSKSLGSNGLTIELFFSFFDLLGNELLEVVEESRRIGKVSVALNATFI